MYLVKGELPADRTERTKRNRHAPQESVEYKGNSGDRIKILHPTKGWRDRNQDRMIRHQLIEGALAERGKMARQLNTIERQGLEVDRKHRGSGRVL